MLFTSIRKYTVLILCFLSIGAGEAQRRYQIGGREEYTLSDMLGITVKDVDGKVDAFFGLHANQYVGSHHLFGFSAEGSWTSFANNVPVASMRPGGGALGVHFLYEYQYSGLLIQTGLGINAQQVFTNVADADIYHEHVRDTWDGIEEADITLSVSSGSDAMSPVISVHKYRSMSVNISSALTVWDTGWEVFILIMPSGEIPNKRCS